MAIHFDHSIPIHWNRPNGTSMCVWNRSNLLSLFLITILTWGRCRRKLYQFDIKDPTLTRTHTSRDCTMYTFRIVGRRKVFATFSFSRILVKRRRETWLDCPMSAWNKWMKLVKFVYTKIKWPFFSARGVRHCNLWLPPATNTSHRIDCEQKWSVFVFVFWHWFSFQQTSGGQCQSPHLSTLMFSLGNRTGWDYRFSSRELVELKSPSQTIHGLKWAASSSLS